MHCTAKHVPGKRLRRKAKAVNILLYDLTRDVWLVQVQGMMQAAYSYRNAFHAVASIVQQQGLPGLMKGYWATNSVWFPWNMIYIASYEKSKTMLAHNLQAGITSLPNNICRDASICELVGTSHTCSWIHVLSSTCLKSSLNYEMPAAVLCTLVMCPWLQAVQSPGRTGCRDSHALHAWLCPPCCLLLCLPTSLVISRQLVL